MNIRKANPNDKDNILEITNLLKLNVPNFVWNKDSYVERQLDKEEYFVGEDEEGKVFGIISFRKRGEAMYIETLAIKQEKQANGYGAEFISFAKQYTKNQQLNMLRACAFFDYNNKEFYLSNGFNLLRNTGSYNGRKFYRFEMKVD